MIRISKTAKAILTTPNSIQKLVFKTFTLFFLFSSLQSNGQLTINGDVYIADNGQMHIDLPKTVFKEGTVTADRGTGKQYGLMSFGKNSIAEGADHNSHVNGFVRSHNTENFVYPIGHDNILQPVHFKSDNENAVLDFAYSHVPHTVLDADIDIDKVSDEFYWTVKGEGKIRVYLSWNTFSNLDKLTDNKLENLAIVGYDGSEWKIIPAELDDISFQDGATPTLLAGSISSMDLIEVKNYSAFTLARPKPKSGKGFYDFNVSESITPNGDGINDTWFVEDILDYPNSRIKIFNRLGQVVFQAIGYKNDWRGNYKNEGDTLPESSYYYTIDLDGDGTLEKAGWIYITK